MATIEVLQPRWFHEHSDLSCCNVDVQRIGTLALNRPDQAAVNHEIFQRDMYYEQTGYWTIKTHE